MKRYCRPGYIVWSELKIIVIKAGTRQFIHMYTYSNLMTFRISDWKDLYTKQCDAKSLLALSNVSEYIMSCFKDYLKHICNVILHIHFFCAHLNATEHFTTASNKNLYFSQLNSGKPGDALNSLNPSNVDCIFLGIKNIRNGYPGTINKL